METWEFAFFATQTGVAITGMVIIIIQLWMAIAAIKVENKRRKRDATIGMINNLREDIRARTNEIGTFLTAHGHQFGNILEPYNLKFKDHRDDYRKTGELLSRDEIRNDVFVVLGYFERIAVGYEQDAYDLSIISGIVGTNFIRWYGRLHPKVLLIREKNPLAYAGAEEMCRQLIVRQNQKLKKHNLSLSEMR